MTTTVLIGVVLVVWLLICAAAHAHALRNPSSASRANCAPVAGDPR